MTNEEEKIIQAGADELVRQFSQFRSDAMRRLAQRGVPVGVACEIICRGIYECLFDAVRFKIKLSGNVVDSMMEGHAQALSNWKTHEAVAQGISSIMINALERTRSRYNWRVVLMKQERTLT